MQESDLLNNPALYGHGCVLSAFGNGFDAELFLSQTVFPPEVVLAYGKLGFPEQFKQQVIETEGAELAGLFEATILVLKLSQSGVNAVQYEEAAAFLEQYRGEILRLSRFPKVEQVNLRCAAANSESAEAPHPDKLLELAAECGLTGLM
jgi:hypothetical protein